MRKGKMYESESISGKIVVMCTRSEPLKDIPVFEGTCIASSSPSIQKGSYKQDWHKQDFSPLNGKLKISKKNVHPRGFIKLAQGT